MTPEHLRELLDYNPLMGDMRWRWRTLLTSPQMTMQGVRGFNTQFAGKVIGSIDDEGYKRTKIYSKGYKLSRLAWAIYHGEWPKDQIDHINGNRADNRIINLRDVTQFENQRNKVMYSSNTSGHTGVHWESIRSKWVAQLTIDGVQKTLGLFDTKEDAIEARRIAQNETGLFTERHGK